MNENDEQRRMGKSMLWLFWVFALGGLILFFGNWEQNQYNPNQNVKGATNSNTQTISLKRNRFGHYVASGSINAQSVTFMLDTGATKVSIPSSIADKLKLRKGQAISVMTANGIAKAYQTEVKHLKIGAIELTNVSAAITPGMLGSEILLGMSALKQLDFSQSGDVLTLTQYSN